MTAETCFANFFASEMITTPRLYNFSEDTISRMRKANSTDDWTEILSELQPAAEELGKEIGEVDTTVNVLMGDTDMVDEVLESFSGYMSENEPFIARALGGRGTPAFLEFYPAGVKEYSRINKTSASILMGRVAVAGDKYIGTLGQQIASTLIGFNASYKAAREVQEGGKSSVGENRSQRSAARKKLEMLLLRAVYQVGDKYPADIERCKSFFEFDRLYSNGLHKAHGKGNGQAEHESH